MAYIDDSVHEKGDFEDIFSVSKMESYIKTPPKDRHERLPLCVHLSKFNLDGIEPLVRKWFFLKSMRGSAPKSSQRRSLRISVHPNWAYLIIFI